MALSDPLVSVEDLSTFMRTTFAIGPEEDQAYLVLQVVSAWVRTTGGKNWNSTNLLPPDDVVGVVLSASRRELNNPDRIISESMGPISVTRAAPPEGFFTRGELSILQRKSGGSLFTISTRREDEAWGYGYINMREDARRRGEKLVGYIHTREDLSDEPLPYLNEDDPGHSGLITP